MYDEILKQKKREQEAKDIIKKNRILRIFLVLILINYFLTGVFVFLTQTNDNQTDPNKNDFYANQNSKDKDMEKIFKEINEENKTSNKNTPNSTFIDTKDFKDRFESDGTTYSEMQEIIDYQKNNLIKISKDNYNNIKNILSNIELYIENEHYILNPKKKEIALENLKTLYHVNKKDKFVLPKDIENSYLIFCSFVRPGKKTLFIELDDTNFYYNKNNEIEWCQGLNARFLSNIIDEYYYKKNISKIDLSAFSFNSGVIEVTEKNGKKDKYVIQREGYTYWIKKWEK